ncbi:hypothetical protein RJ639_028836 [Escallonia herrerae]|uniref:Uncharacterized protein n=1 Tax=Escallonia herrerae TaxID=1293975 RepID=A0AA89BED9_9ASTE|nr:hypothetical protein RJ639_028836 [Escallonia herrerae]
MVALVVEVEAGGGYAMLIEDNGGLDGGGSGCDGINNVGHNGDGTMALPKKMGLKCNSGNGAVMSVYRRVLVVMKWCGGGDDLISYILDLELSPPPEEPRTSAEGVPPDAEEFERVKKERKKREEDELLCCGHILNGLSDRLYDLFTEIKFAHDIWSALDYKYKAEEECTNKYHIAQYFDFVMVDDKPVLEQVHGLQDYRKKLLHKSEDITLEQFQKHLRIEEESRKRENKVTVPVESNVHYVDGSGSQSKNPALQVRKNDEQFKKKANQDREQRIRKEAAMFAGKRSHAMAGRPGVNDSQAKFDPCVKSF